MCSVITCVCVRERDREKDRVITAQQKIETGKTKKKNIFFCVFILYNMHLLILPLAL